MSKHTNREVNNFPNNAAKFSRCLSLLFGSYFFFNYSLSCTALLVCERRLPSLSKLELLLSDWIGCCGCWTWIGFIIRFALRVVSSFSSRLSLQQRSSPRK